MRIKQAYISPSVADFPFLRCLNLEPYHDVEAPAVFYGVYTDNDLMKILNHQGFKVIRWCGHDAFNFRHWGMLWGCHHVTPLWKVYQLVNEMGGYCELIKPENLDMVMNPTPKESKIYAYVPASFPEYHGIDIIKQLGLEHKIVIGDGRASRAKWYGGLCDPYYDNTFIGLMLSPFAGGGQSVVDMGLRGKKCITNVIILPNTIPWENMEDIRRAINQEMQTIGQTDTEMAQRVFQAIDKDYGWLDTNFCY